jgi:hypothetical protein
MHWKDHFWLKNGSYVATALSAIVLAKRGCFQRISKELKKASSKASSKSHTDRGGNLSPSLPLEKQNGPSTSKTKARS